MSHSFKKLVAGFLAAAMALFVAVPAFAQTKELNPADTDNATITIKNPAKGETYTIYKLFDATTQGSGDNAVIAYQSTEAIPNGLTQYFTKDSANNVTATAEAKTTDGSMSEGLKSALSTWADTATATNSETSDGSELQFTGLPYGYYVVVTTHGQVKDDQGKVTAKAAITVDSTEPSATIYDKNSTTPVTNESKKAYTSAEATQETTNFNIGDTVYYKVTFNTSNYSGSGSSAKQITKYVIADTLPAFLSNVTVDSVTIGGQNYYVSGTSAPQFGTDSTDTDTYKKITIPWVDGEKKSLYADGAQVVVTYHATLADSATIDSTGNNNQVTITPYNGDTPDTPNQKTTNETVYTYAFAIQKTDINGKGLKDATFQLPFYVNSTPAPDGAYVYAGTSSGAGLTNTLTTPEGGLIVVKGVKSAQQYELIETEAPAGYNKLTNSVKVTPVQTKASTTTKYFTINEKGEATEVNSSTEAKVTVSIEKLAATPVVVVNQTGGELPSTGGMGTTIFTVVGSVLVIGAACALVAKKRTEK